MSRSENRHHAERIKRRVLDYYGGWPRRAGCRVVGKVARTHAVCSRPCCGNPRRHFGQRKGVERVKTWTEKGIDGETVTRMLPETGADVEEIRKMAEVGDLDDRESFGDCQEEE